MVKLTKQLIKQDKNSRKPRLFFTGLSMGLADLVPGVSGGTIAFLFGIYDELLYSIKILSGEIPRRLIRGDFKEAMNLVPFGFLLPLGAGILTAIFGFVHVVSYLLENHTVLIWSLFFGLVLGSVYVVSKRVPSWNLNRITLIFLGFIVTYAVLGLSVSQAGFSPLTLFLTGAIASVAMILPGISGSLIMVMLGQYKNVVTAVAERNLPYLVVFAMGAFIGLALFSRLLSWLLKNHHSGVIAFLIGIMIGSLRKIWPWQVEQSADVSVNVLPDFNIWLLYSLLLSVAGYFIVLRLEKIGVAREHIDIDNKEYVQEIASQHD